MKRIKLQFFKPVFLHIGTTDIFWRPLVGICSPLRGNLVFLTFEDVVRSVCVRTPCPGLAFPYSFSFLMTLGSKILSAWLCASKNDLGASTLTQLSSTHAFWGVKTLTDCLSLFSPINFTIARIPPRLQLLDSLEHNSRVISGDSLQFLDSSPGLSGVVPGIPDVHGRNRFCIFSQVVCLMGFTLILTHFFHSILFHKLFFKGLPLLLLENRVPSF